MLEIKYVKDGEVLNIVVYLRYRRQSPYGLFRQEGVPHVRVSKKQSTEMSEEEADIGVTSLAAVDKLY